MRSVAHEVFTFHWMKNFQAPLVMRRTASPPRKRVMNVVAWAGVINARIGSIVKRRILH
jgi:hypothetical protein